MASSSAYPPIGDYALIGDCHTAALIARDGSIDWFCPGRFDAPAVFCRLLDAHRGGYLRAAPGGSFSSDRGYRGPTNVLQTTLSSAQGRVRFTDLMPIHRRTAHRQGYDVGTSQRLLRLIEGVAGEVELELCYKPTFDFARAATEMSIVSDLGAVAGASSTYLTLACRGVALERGPDGGVRGRIRVRSGDRLWLVLTFAQDPDRAEEALAPVRCQEQLERTLQYWQHWAAQCTYRGPRRDAVLRSALVLKLLTYEPTGALVAAPTTSLPEQIGGERNWDYRYTWLRDSSLILYALMTVGYREEAADFMHWLEQTIGSDPTRAPQIMYGIDGRRKLPEQTVDQLEGYRQSRPVRTGNGAAEQRQLDIFGEVLRAAHLHYRGRADDTDAARPDAEAWQVLRGLVQQAAEHWAESGRGIWEVRGGPRPFLYGKLMCWAALDAGIRLADEHGLAAPLEAWRRTRDKLRQAILERGYDPELGAFTQSFGSRNLDASALMIPRIGFLPATDARVRSTLACIQRQLSRDGLVFRYRTADGLPGGEGTFTLCTFWLADALALSGQLDEAEAVFERAVRSANDVGLLAEEIDAGSGEQLGNYPQGFSHMALIGAAVDIAKVAEQGAEEQARTEADRAGRASRAATSGGGRR
jgi:alpha,alpha-trehalase